MNRNIRKILLFIIVFFTINNISASDELIECEKSDEYLRWLELSDKEKENVIMPNICKEEQINKGSTNTFSNVKGTLDSYYKSTSSAVKNQYDVGACWAFSSSTVLESFLQIKYNKTFNFSTRHMDYTSSRSNFLNGEINPIGFNRKVGSGGNYYIASNYYINNYGPIDYEEMPFENNNNYISLSSIQNKKVLVDVNEIKISDTGESCTQSRLDTIKQDIQDNGPISINVYMNTKTYYNNTTYGYYYNYASSSSTSPSLVNHSITIIGWDDNYSKNNFKSTPSRDGAFIVQNSYGNSFGKDGTFYLSYDDYYACKGYMQVEDADFELEDHLYSIDELGMNAGIAYGKNNYGYAATVFDKISGKEEQIKEITIATRGSGEYEIYYYGGKISSTMSKSSYMLIGSGTYSHDGYITHKVTSNFTIPQDVNKYTIIVHYFNSTNSSPIPASTNSSSTSEIYKTMNFESERSFTSLDGTSWIDLYSAFSNAQYEASIKVSTNDSPARIENVSSTIEYNDNIVLKITYNGVNIDNLNLSLKDSLNNLITPKSISYPTQNSILITLSNDMENGIYTLQMDYGEGTYEENFTIDKQEISNITLSNENLSLNANSCINLPNVEFTPSAGIITSITWSVSNNDLAYISNNKICANNVVGSFILTAQTINDKTATANVTILKPITNISLNKSTTSIEITKEETIAATIYPSDTTDEKNITWTSSDDKIVSVDSNGKITALKRGIATITAKSVNGKTATCNVTVIEPRVLEIVPETSSYTKTILDNDFKINIKEVKLEANPSYTIKYESLDTNILTVDENGIVHMVNPGQASIKIYAYDAETIINVYVKSLKELPIKSVPKINISKGNNNSLILKWEENDYSTGYYIYRSTSKSGKYSKIAAVTTNTYTNSGLTYGKTYYYKIIAYNKVSKTSYSNIVYKNVTPNTITNLKAYSWGTNNIKISWDKVSSSGYEIYRSTDGKKWSKIKTITSSSTAAYNNTYLASNKTYYYKIRAYKTVSGKKIYGSYSSAIKTKTSPAKTLISVSNKNYNSLKISVKAVSGAKTYRIYRSSSEKGTYSQIGTMDGTTVYVDNELETGITYYYKVKACNSENHCSSNSKIVSKKVIPSTPKATITKQSKLEVKIDVNEVVGATGYVLYYSTSKNGKYTKVAVFKDTSYIYTLKSNKKYYYKLRAYTKTSKGNIYSNYSAYYYI